MYKNKQDKGMNNKVRLTEKQLHQVIKESVSKFLNEIGNYNQPKRKFDSNRYNGGGRADIEGGLPMNFEHDNDDPSEYRDYFGKHDKMCEDTDYTWEYDYFDKNGKGFGRKHKEPKKNLQKTDYKDWDTWYNPFTWKNNQQKRAMRRDSEWNDYLNKRKQEDEHRRSMQDLERQERDGDTLPNGFIKKGNYAVHPRLTESQLHSIVNDAIKKIINETLSNGYSALQYQQMAKQHNSMGGYTGAYHMPNIPQGMNPEDFYKQLSDEQDAQQRIKDNGKEFYQNRMNRIGQMVNIQEFSKYMNELEDGLNTEWGNLYNNSRASRDADYRAYLIQDLKRKYAKQAWNYAKQLGLNIGEFEDACYFAKQKGLYNVTCGIGEMAHRYAMGYDDL